MKTQRNYSCKDVNMLLSAKTIAKNFKTHLSELSDIHVNWTEQYADDLIARIDDAINSHLGVDTKKGLRNATSLIHSVMTPALNDLACFKTLIFTEFKQDKEKRNEILATLGFSKHYKKVQKKYQEDLVQLLYTFKTNMTDSLRQNITAKGLKNELIDKIISYADNFREANIAQEEFKGSSKEITLENRKLYNSIYDEILGICKNASLFYKNEPVKKEIFTFNKVAKKINTIKKAEDITKENDKPDLPANNQEPQSENQ